MLNQYYLGVYRTSMSTVGQIMGLITAATTPVLFSSLSRLQDNDEELKRMFFSFQKLVGILVIPLGVGIYLFRDLITEVLLGSQWTEAAYFIGLWGLTSSITIVFAHYCSEMFRAKGKPRLSVLAQVLHMAFLIPTVLWAVDKGFDTLCEARALVRLTGVVINTTILYFLVKISFVDMIKNILPATIASLAMLVVTLGILICSEKLYWQILCVVIAIFVYVLIIMLSPKERHIIFNLKKYINR